ncbi:hypothetical protein FN846DRAFT_782198, partial [Sphaerosporella brunnea]
ASQSDATNIQEASKTALDRNGIGAIALKGSKVILRRSGIGGSVLVGVHKDEWRLTEFEDEG